MTPSEILRKHEDANEMHFHEVYRKWIIEAMEEYAKEKSEKAINLTSSQTENKGLDWLISHWKKLQSEGEKMNWEQIIQITELAKYHNGFIHQRTGKTND